ncbi:MAG: glycine--tRNA ligase subunit beta, partial [Dialister micraerophilus]|nr:glycine--tRNA ligase subunit beta [Dialister micraerophilus]
MSKNLLLEIGTEEMPAKIMPGLVEQLNQLANIEMKNARLSFDDVKVYATPRRLAVIIEKSSEIQSDENLRKRGPSIKAAFDKEGNPTRALQGFAKSQKVGIEKIEKEGEYTWANITNKGKKIQEVLPVIFKNLISNLNFSRSMNWGTEKERFIRPIRWLVAMCDEEIIPVEFAHVKSGNISRGHRFLASDHVEIKNAESYKETMKKSFVIVDQDERRQMIIEGLKKVSEKLNGILWENKGLL